MDLTTAWKDQDNARQGAATTRQTTATNEEAYASAETLYRNGKAIGLDVLQAQVDLTGSRFNYIKYAVAYEIGRARIRQVIGSGQPPLNPPSHRETKTVKLPAGRKAIGTGIGILIIIVLGYRLIWQKIPLVPVIAVKQVEIHGQVHGPGTVQSRVPVAVSAKITGILEKLHADQGDRVKKGQLLAELDALELRARQAAAYAAKSQPSGR